MTDTSVLSVQSRLHAVDELGRGELDVLVIGGGVVGAGIALDAATRGLSVGIVEAQDWASGTSSRSTKLIHGGLRYLAVLDFYLVREALKERGLLLEVIAPHLVTKLPFLFPLRRRLVERVYMAAGISLYDALSWSTRSPSGVPRQRQLSRRAVSHSHPGLRQGLFVGGIEYYDAQVDDARFVVALVRTAARLGAFAVSRMAAIGVVRENGVVVGARLRDIETGIEMVARARSVIFATGVWTEGSDIGLHEDPPMRVRPSKGVHITVSRDKIALSTAVVTRTEKSFLFIIPWGSHWLIGTTDTAWEESSKYASATATDISYLINHVNAIVSTPIAESDVESVFSGLRPLIFTSSKDTTKLSREHAIDKPSPGLVVISGGKFTTYRVMAKEAVDTATRSFRVPPSLTESTPLIGASGFRAYSNQRARIALRYGLREEQVAHLFGRYGTLIEEVLAPAVEEPSLLASLAGAPSYLRAEVLYGVTHEGALHIEDITRRRLRIDIETHDRGLGSLDDVSSVMGAVLHWDDVQKKAEVDAYKHLVAIELEAQRQLDDAGASAIMGALGVSSWNKQPVY